MASPSAALARLRARRPFLDHLIRAFNRYQDSAGDRLAASVTFFGFLSFFPLMALAAAVLSFALGDDAITRLVAEVNAYAAGLADQLGLETLLRDNRTAGTAGLAGLLGLLYAGLGWVDALRQAIRVVWHHNVKAGNLVVKKARDVLTLGGLGLTLVLSIAISGLTGAFTGSALDLIGLEQTASAQVVARLVGVGLGLGTSTLLFLYLFWRLPRLSAPFDRVLRAAVLAAVLFEILKRVGATYIERTTENPLYGTFAVVVGLLVWINIGSRMLLFCAAWAVTAPYDSDVSPSGTASSELARQAGVPPEFARATGSPATIEQDGAATPLLGALEREPVEVGVGPVGVGRAVPAQTRVVPVVVPGSAELRAVQAGQFTAGALGMLLAAVLLSVLRTLRNAVRR